MSNNFGFVSTTNAVFLNAKNNIPNFHGQSSLFSALTFFYQLWNRDFIMAENKRQWK